MVGNSLLRLLSPHPQIWGVVFSFSLDSVIFFFLFRVLWWSYPQSIVCYSTIGCIFCCFSCWFLVLFNYSKKIRNHSFLFVKIFLRPIIDLVIETVPWFSGKNVYFEWNVSHIPVGSIWTLMLFNLDVSLFIFWWNSYWLKLNVKVTYSYYIEVNLCLCNQIYCFIKLGPLMIGIYILKCYHLSAELLP